MNLKTHMKNLTDSLTGVGENPSPKIIRTSGMTPATATLDSYTGTVARLQEEVSDLTKKQGQAVRIAMDLCDDGPHHSSAVDPKRVENLKGNIGQNGQSSPALLRAMPDGRYQIVAGRHRKAALLALGETEWDAVIKDLDEDAAERLTFYDNLLAPTLSDYQRYLGFVLRKNSKSMTATAVAEEVGFSKSLVARCLSFEKLSPEIHAIILQNQEAVTARMAELLAPLLQSHGERVTEAFKLVVNGSLLPTKAKDWVLAEVAKPSTVRPVEDVIRKGASVVAKMSWRSNKLLIDFSSMEDGKALEAEIKELISKRLSSDKSK